MSDDASRARTMEKEAAGLMSELADLTSKLREVGKAEAKAGAEALSGTLDDLQARIKALAADGETLQKIDKSVRANPYLYILGALIAGLLLGKTRRS